MVLTGGQERQAPLPLLKTLAMISLLLPVLILAVSLSLLIILLVIINLKQNPLLHFEVHDPSFLECFPL